MTTPINALINIDAIDEGDAAQVFWALSEKFEWVTTLISPDTLDGKILTKEEWANAKIFLADGLSDAVKALCDEEADARPSYYV